MSPRSLPRGHLYPVVDKPVAVSIRISHIGTVVLCCLLSEVPSHHFSLLQWRNVSPNSGCTQRQVITTAGSGLTGNEVRSMCRLPAHMVFSTSLGHLRHRFQLQQFPCKSTSHNARKRQCPRDAGSPTPLASYSTLQVPWRAARPGQGSTVYILFC